MTIVEDVTSDFFSSTPGLESYRVYHIGNLFILNMVAKSGLSSGWVTLAQIDTSKYNILVGFTYTGINGISVSQFSAGTSTGVIQNYATDRAKTYTVTADMLANKIS